MLTSAMLTYILIGLAVLILAVLIAAALQPDSYRIHRSTVIAAPQATVFEHCNDLTKYIVWNPFGKADPDATQTVTPQTSGTGSSLAWEGKRIGAGRMTNVETLPHELLRFRMDFLRPMAEVAEAKFALAPTGSHTEITWSITGTNSFMRKLMGLLLNFEKMIGSSFASGLKELKTILESQTTL